MSQEPAHWSAPIWLALPPALLLLGICTLGLVLSMSWARESYNASVVTHRLLTRSSNGRTSSKPLPEHVVPPALSWWQTTPLHLAEWGVYLGRSASADEQTVEPQELLEGAIRISPINPTARLAHAQLGSASGKMTSPAQNLGFSRDAAGLAWSARALRKAGKKEAAIRAYRKALELACFQQGTSILEPVFNDDPGSRRYFLPGETNARAIVAELIADSDEGYEAWATAIPRETVATLAVARLLREQGRTEADALLERIIEPGSNEISISGNPSIRAAMLAEAFALLSRWKEAGQKYREAIDLTDDLTTKRSWWFNLASVAAQLEDESGRRLALEAALEVSSDDDISRRAIELQRTSELPGRLRSSGAKAN